MSLSEAKSFTLQQNIQRVLFQQEENKNSKNEKQHMFDYRKLKVKGQTCESFCFLKFSLLWKKDNQVKQIHFQCTPKAHTEVEKLSILTAKKNYFPNQPLTVRWNKVYESQNQNPKWFIWLAITTTACLHFRHDTQVAEGRVTVWAYCKETRAQAKQINLDFNRTYCFEKY